MKSVGGPDFFPTERDSDTGSTHTIDEVARQIGAPVGPIPASFQLVPPRLAVCNPLATERELSIASKIRTPFALGGYPPPYLNDVVRAFRLITGMHTYMEIGTFDRGNLAYVASLLAEDALLIGVDVQAEEECDARLRASLRPNQTYISIVGDSRLPEIVAQVKERLGPRPLDAVYIDGDHTAFGVMCDYVNYAQLVAHDGVILTHDSVWEGNSTFKGSGYALQQIDRLDPIYLVPGWGVCHRYLPVMFRDDVWGVVGVSFPNEHLAAKLTAAEGQQMGAPTRARASWRITAPMRALGRLVRRRGAYAAASLPPEELTRAGSGSMSGAGLIVAERHALGPARRGGAEG